MKKTVGLGISGGVDSAVSVHILKSEGYEVVGFFMQNWDGFLNNSSGNCSNASDWNDALLVANHFKIKIHRVNFIEEYWNDVFSDFLFKIGKGLTPNPDILCNKNIKFNYFIEYMRREFSINYFATGHYARIIEENSKYYLLKHGDQKKDQSYFLCQIDKKILKNFIFPLSNLKKEEVRRIAEKIGLFNFKKKDSFGICFIGEDKFDSFLLNYFPKKSGNIIDIENGKIIGKHDNFYYFTIGQRRGLNLHGQRSPFYVVGKNVSNFEIYVDKIIGRENSFVYSSWCIVEEVIWLLDDIDLKKIVFDNKGTFFLKAKFRYQQKEIQINIDYLNNSFEKIKIFFFSPQKSVTIGQYAVIYFNDICLGGGSIIDTESNNELGKKSIFF